ncbi:hypothetical protein SUDANB121_00255 [Nocardiopsis dassonvillei]|uniref:hypothetical protein n=1 Tax=Nocardiopsis dassonvillei TaxID=2014 RepID=UPI003F55DC91
MNPSPQITAAQNQAPKPSPVPRKRPEGSLRLRGFSPLVWVTEVIDKGLLPSLRSCLAAVLIARATDRDGRWCFMRQATLVERSGGTLSLTTARRAIADLVRAGVVRKLPREQVREFFAQDLAAGRRRADALPDVLELLIPAAAFPADFLERVNEARALLGEEPLTPDNRPDLPATGRSGAPRPVEVTGRGVSDRPTDPSPNDPRPNDPSPDPVRGRVTTGAVVPRPRTAPDAAEPPGAAPPAVGAADGPADAPPPAPPYRGPSHPAPPSPPGWALDLLRLIPDAALTRPHRDRRVLAARLADLRSAGVASDELAAALSGWQDTARPYAALRARLDSPEAVRAWNSGVLIRDRPRPAPEGDAFARRPAFTLDSRGRAVRTCPDHPGVRNVPGGACAVCGGPCRTEPDEVVHPPAARGGDILHRWLGAPDVDALFTAPKCGNEHCNGDKASPRYRTVIRLTPDGRDAVPVPCPVCGRRTRRTADAA